MWKNWKERGLNYERERKEQLYQKRNYDHYHFSMKELLKYMGQALALCIMADYLFTKVNGVASYASVPVVLSEMAEKSYDQGKTEESELSV